MGILEIVYNIDFTHAHTHTHIVQLSAGIEDFLVVGGER